MAEEQQNNLNRSVSKADGIAPTLSTVTGLRCVTAEHISRVIPKAFFINLHSPENILFKEIAEANASSNNGVNKSSRLIQF